MNWLVGDGFWFLHMIGAGVIGGFITLVIVLVQKAGKDGKSQK